MLRILYAGSPEAAAIPLMHLGKAETQGKGFTIVGVLTNPPSAQGRSKALIPTPVAQAAQKLEAELGRSIPVLTPEKLDATARDAVAELQPDLLVCFAYGKIFGPKFLSLFPMGGINLHPSLLPLYRGCAPIPAAILDRQPETGVTVQKIALEMDSGNILSQVTLPLSGTETADSLLLQAAEIGGKQLEEVILQAAEIGALPEGLPQDGSKATYCQMMKKEEGCICWNDSAAAIDAKIRAFTPWPGAFTCAQGTTLKIHQAKVYQQEVPAHIQAAYPETPAPGTVLGMDKAQGILVQTGDGILCVTNLQWQAKKAMSWKDFMNGSPSFAGCCCSIN